MLGVRNCQPNTVVRSLPKPAKVVAAQPSFNHEVFPKWALGSDSARGKAPNFYAHKLAHRRAEVASASKPDLESLLYLFACQVQWEMCSDNTAAWEVIAAARSSDEELRGHALSLIEHSENLRREARNQGSSHYEYRKPKMEAGMRTPYGLEIIESCMGCKASREGSFCKFSTPVSRATDMVSHHTVMPAGAVLFVEGQTPRGIFILCSGKVKLSTTSREGKVLILKQAEAGEVLGLSAAVSATNYEMTAETASPCQLNFIGRNDLMHLLQTESEVGMHAALWLSREFQSAYRDIHDLVLARSSSGKLARLLLSCAPPPAKDAPEQHLRSPMTHEEMAQRIGSSRETVTRLLSDLKKRRLIRLDGTSLIIRDRVGLESLAV